jgi:subtilisin
LQYHFNQYNILRSFLPVTQLRVSIQEFVRRDIMGEKRRKIVVIKEGFTAEAVAKESVSKVIKRAQIIDAVSVMATDFMPDESAVLANEEFRLVFGNMTDAQAKDLAGKAGVESVEDDEVVYAWEDKNPSEMDDFGDEFMEFDEEASLDIEAEMADIADDELDLVTPEQAALASQVKPNINEIEIDEAGNIMSLDESDLEKVETGRIPRAKIMALVKCVINRATEQFGGKVQDVTDEKIRELLAELDLPGDSGAGMAAQDYIPCGLRIIYAPQAWRYSTGAGVRVAVVDTGIAPHHPDLRVYGGASFVPGVTRWHDDHYHGTHVAGTIAATTNQRGIVGIAPAARLYAVKVLNRHGRGYTSWLLNGLAWCYRNGMHVVNLSLGSGASTHSTRNYSRACDNAGRLLRRRGILPIAAAGNLGSSSQPYVGNPARCPSFMAVSSIDCNRRRSSFSSYGPQVEICAPGTNVLSTFAPNGYRQLSGTSMATPHVAGVAALVKSRYPSWTGDRIRVHLWRTAMDLGRPERDWLFGYGQVRAYHAVR